MRGDRRALEGFPLKLLIVLLLISLSLPLFLSTFGAYEERLLAAGAKEEMERVVAAATSAFMDGPGGTRVVNIRLPPGAPTMEIGGKLGTVDARSVRLVLGEEAIHRCYPEITALEISSSKGGALLVDSDCRVSLTCVSQHGYGTWVRVEVIS